MSRTTRGTLAVASCLVLLATGCSKHVDSASVEKDVVRVVKTQLPSLSDVSAKCPGDVKAEKGKTFTCTLSLDGKTTKVKIAITDVKKKQFFFKPEYSQAIISTTDYAKALARRAGAGSKAECGTEKLVLKNRGDIITCTVTAKGSEKQTLKLRVRDTNGNLDPVA